MKKYALDPDDMRPKLRKTAVRNPQVATKHVPVRDASPQLRREEPLSAYMVSPQYLPRNVITKTAPKRPLGQPPPQTRNLSWQPDTLRPTPRQPLNRQPMKMHNQVATFGSMDRIRRPRFQQPHHIPVAEEASGNDEGSLFEKAGSYLLAGAAAIGAALIFVWDSAANAGHFIVQKLQSMSFGRTNIRYSARAGTVYKRFGIHDNWLRTSVPVILLLFLLGLGLFSALDNGSGNSPNGSSGGNQANGGSQGGTVLQVTPSANNGSNGTSTKGNRASGKNGTSAAGTAASSGGGSTATTPSSGSAAGGMGGGGTLAPITVGSSVPSYSISAPGTQSAPTQSIPVSPPQTISGGSGGGGGSTSGGSTGGTTSGGTSGGSGGGISLPLNPPTTPFPTTTVTVPPTNVTSGGKTIVSTSPISGTLN